MQVKNPLNGSNTNYNLYGSSKYNILDKLLGKFKYNIKKKDITLLQFMSKLLKYCDNKHQFKGKKLPGCFKRSPCGSDKKYKNCCGK